MAWPPRPARGRERLAQPGARTRRQEAPAHQCLDMPGSSAFSFLRTLCSLRWLAIAGQAATILLASSLLRLDLPLEPLWTGVGVLIGFNLYAILRLRLAATCPT